MTSPADTGRTGRWRLASTPRHLCSYAPELSIIHPSHPSTYLMLHGFQRVAVRPEDGQRHGDFPTPLQASAPDRSDRSWLTIPA